jgi:Na+/proline symporter
MEVSSRQPTPINRVLLYQSGGQVDCPFQIALMAVLGIVAELRVHYAHTLLEIIKRRYGKYAHWLFVVLNLINNIFGCGSMILAGAQRVTGMTGMNVIAACILIPVEGKLSEEKWQIQTLIFVL